MQTHASCVRLNLFFVTSTKRVALQFPEIIRRMMTVSWIYRPFDMRWDRICHAQRPAVGLREQAPHFREGISRHPEQRPREVRLPGMDLSACLIAVARKNARENSGSSPATGAWFFGLLETPPGGQQPGADRPHVSKRIRVRVEAGH